MRCFVSHWVTFRVEFGVEGFDALDARRKAGAEESFYSQETYLVVRAGDEISATTARVLCESGAFEAIGPDQIRYITPRPATLGWNVIPFLESETEDKSERRQIKAEFREAVLILITEEIKRRNDAEDARTQ